MFQDEINGLASELFSLDMPGVIEASIQNGRLYQVGKFSKIYVETDQVVGVRSTFLCPVEFVGGVVEGDPIKILNVDYIVEAIEVEGLALVRFILCRA
ncbi:MAG: hypothetical protein GY818_07080 [Planctomycetaceae bacterium]|nr:hypothetical protein [Planctomycetaceae bacterium]